MKTDAEYMNEAWKEVHALLGEEPATPAEIAEIFERGASASALLAGLQPFRVGDPVYFSASSDYNNLPAGFLTARMAHDDDANPYMRFLPRQGT